MKKVFLEMSEIMVLAIREDVKNNKGTAINWENISHKYNLSEDFIREFQDKVIWYNKVYWAHICRHQKLSKEFIVEFADKVNFQYILMNENISNDVKDYCGMFI